ARIAQSHCRGWTLWKGASARKIAASPEPADQQVSIQPDCPVLSRIPQARVMIAAISKAATKSSIASSSTFVARRCRTDRYGRIAMASDSRHGVGGESEDRRDRQRDFRPLGRLAAVAPS